MTQYENIQRSELSRKVKFASVSESDKPTHGLTPITQVQRTYVYTVSKTSKSKVSVHCSHTTPS